VVTLALACVVRNCERDAVAAEEAVIEGECDPAFTSVRDAFARNFADGSELGASLCIDVDGRRVVDLWGGWLDADRARPWTRDSIVCVFSCTKGLAAIVLLQLVDRGLVDLDAPVARYWPEFAAEDKEELPVRHLLTHEAGLPAIGRPLPLGSLSDWDLMTEALAAQRPWWAPGTAHGYHGVTFGHLVGEVARRADGRTIGTLLHDEVTAPLGVDCFLGLPASEDPRTATMVLAPIEGATFFSRWQPDALGPKSFGNPPDCNDPAHTNSRAFRAAEIPAANAHANARALASVYRALARGDLVSLDLVREAGRIHVDGPDLVMEQPTRFGLGFEITLPEADFAFGPGARTFGHNGSGGSLGAIDPDAGVAFGYAMNRMLWTDRRDDPRWPPIFDALYDAI
jgi:CubicO group peptidase (beta-lactamase class C family)